MPKHIGIAACSAEGAALCFRTICLEGEALMGEHWHPEVTMHVHPLGRYMEHLGRGDWPGVATLMLSSAEKLAAAGADFIICPDNTIHQAFDLVVGKSPRPWLHIAEVVATAAKESRYRRLGVLGTRLKETPMEVIGLDHIYVSVSDFARSEAFYDRVMGTLGFRKGDKPIGGDRHAHYFNRSLQYTIRPARNATGDH